MKKALINEINRHMNQYEQQFNIHILFWALRSSINIGIKRKNSDLDVMFSYISKNPENCLGIHDIAGHGLDFFGIEIHEILTTILNNNTSSYEKGGRPIPKCISPQHQRAGCNYYFGIYSILGNSYYQEQNKFITRTCKAFLEMFEKKIAVQQLLNSTKTTIDNIKYYEKNYLYDYLYAIWRLTLCRHIMQNGLPGRNNIHYLINRYCPYIVKEKVNQYLELYKNMYSKQSAFFQIELFNQFIMDNFLQIQQLADAAEFEKQKNCIAAYQEIRKIIDEIQL